MRDPGNEVAIFSSLINGCRFGLSLIGRRLANGNTSLPSVR